MRSSSVVLAALLVVGCSGNSVDSGSDAGEGADAQVVVDDAGNVVVIDGAVVNPPVDGAVVMPVDSGIITGPRRDQVCMRWKNDRADTSEGAFAGNIAMCLPGENSATGKANALKLINLYRFIADLPAVTESAPLSTKAQACSLMMDANNALSHTPPTTWTCYTAGGAEAAGKSNISTTAGVQAIDLYMNDRGNATTMGHRRWLLSNSLGPVGLGSAPGGSCAWVIGGTGNAGKAWRAWPAPGPFPFAAMSQGGFGMTVDVTGWTVQSDSINLGSATVTVTEGGVDRPVTVTQLGANYGSRYAIRFVANGWTSAAGKNYHVVVGGVTTPIAYDVEMVACP